MERGLTMGVPGIRVCFSFDQCFGDLQMSVVRAQMERGRAMVRLAIHICFSFDQCFGDLRMPF